MAWIENWGDWECPECGEEHSDPQYRKTHCRKCGLVVLTGSLSQQYGTLDVFSEGYHIPTDPRDWPAAE
jgi:ribosomal protein L37AE/L43A